ncbi:MAG: choice-of-anchor E domain-containing protein [Planctomycetaceae bacterium]|nr:choice-of-anchor E domain-containing protein [Planctomycetaceae bacterium]
MLESLEEMVLLSPGSPVIGGASVQMEDSTGNMSATASTPVTTAPQTLTIGNPANNTVLTNFQNQPLAPALQLFDPTLGTLTAVTVTHAVVLKSLITSTNLSQSSGTTITANLNGNYEIDGLNQTIPPIPPQTVTAPSQSITVPAFNPSNPSASTATFQPLLATDPTPPTPPTSVTFTDPASLQFYTASASQTSITPTMTANGFASASAANGNNRTTSITSASATITVSYTYTPATCAITRISRIGVHNQTTQLIVAFSGTVNPTLAENVNNYSIIASDGTKIAVVSAVYDATTNSVTLTPAKKLNAHYTFTLSATLPCTTVMTVLVPFGGKPTLIGFVNHRGQFVPITNGVIGKPTSSGGGSSDPTRHVVNPRLRHR